MLVSLITNPQVIAAIAIVLAAIIGVLIKRSVDYNKLIPIINFILSMIIKAENVKGAGNGPAKMEYVINEVQTHLNDEDIKLVTKKHGSILGAVQWVFDKFGQPLILKGVAKYFKI